MAKVKESDVKIVRAGNKAFGVTPVGVYAFDMAGTYRVASPSVLPFYTNNRALQPVRIGEFDIVPNGEQNSYPAELRTILDENNLTQEILNKQAQLLFGQGPALYRINFENGKRIKFWMEDPEIQAWLDTWDYEDYLLRACVEFRTTNGLFTKFFRNRGARIGEPPSITKLELTSSLYSRLEWPDDAGQIHNVIVGDFSQPWKLGLRRYPVFDPQAPFINPVSMMYANLYSFALDNEYSRSPIHGAITWIKLGSSIPGLLASFNSNSMVIKYHIEVPEIYWSKLRDQYTLKCSEKNIEFTEENFEKEKDKVMAAFTLALAGNDKVGKFVQTTSVYDDSAQEYQGWKISPLDQKVADFIDAQINIANEAMFQITSGIGLHPALSNLSKEGNLPSGSEQLYAFKLYLMTGVDIPEGIVMKAINMAIRANFPGKKLRLGFYHDAVITEEMTSPKDRLKNQQPGGTPSGSKGNATQAVLHPVADASLAKCPSCSHVFDYENEPEAGMGYVKCPKCSSPVTQKSLL